LNLNIKLQYVSFKSKPIGFFNCAMLFILTFYRTIVKTCVCARACMRVLPALSRKTLSYPQRRIGSYFLDYN
jgi:hypothetical protein